jgi:xanthine dehydrogenase large subunit
MESRCGYSLDLSAAINDRAMFHADNAYYLKTAEIISHRWRTDTVSNTAFRGFGGPQGMIAIECAIDDAAFALGVDPLDLRLRNVYAPPDRALTPYGGFDRGRTYGSPRAKGRLPRAPRAHR